MVERTLLLSGDVELNPGPLPNENSPLLLFFFFFCILIIFIDYQFYIQFTTLTYYLLHSLTHTYIQAHTHPNDKSTKILKL